MSTEQPGRPSPAVYRRRRIVVGLAVLAAIVIVILLIVRPGSGEPDPNPSDTTSQSPDDDASDASTNPATDDADASEACDPADITLTPVTDAGEYPAGQNPLISMTIVNSGSAACTFNVGTDAQLYSIVSGSDPIWNSKDCQTEAAALDQVLQPGVELTTTPFPWDRTRSAPDTCNSDRAQVAAGGATYRLSVELGEAKSASDAPFLLY